MPTWRREVICPRDVAGAIPLEFTSTFFVLVTRAGAAAAATVRVTEA